MLDWQSTYQFQHSIYLLSSNENTFYDTLALKKFEDPFQWHLLVLRGISH